MATRFKLKTYLLNRENRCNAFPKLTDIIQALNELPTDKRPTVLRYYKIETYALHMSTARKTGFRKNSFHVCYTIRPQLSPFNRKTQEC